MLVPAGNERLNVAIYWRSPARKRRSKRLVRCWNRSSPWPSSSAMKRSLRRVRKPYFTAI